MSHNGSRSAQSSHGRGTFTFPPTDFDADFSRLVGPKLLRLVTAYAYLVQLDLCDWGEAYYAIWNYAWRRGASHLSEDACDELGDWLSHELMVRVDDPPMPGVLTPAQVEALMRWRV